MDTKYSRKAFHSKYPGEPGDVIKIVPPVNRYNKQVGCFCDHECFIWIQRRGNKRKTRCQRTRIRCLFMFIPLATGVSVRYDAYEEIIQMESLQKRHLYQEHTLVGKVPFRYKSKGCYQQFYELIGLVPKVRKKKKMNVQPRRPTPPSGIDKPDCAATT
jgi:hypothetical protein